MTKNEIYIGESHAVEAFREVFQFYNIHLYILLGLISIGVTLLVASSKGPMGALSNLRALYIGILSCASLLSYSHYFDDWLSLLGFDQNLITNYSRALIGLAILGSIIRGRRALIAASLLYLTVIVPSFFEWSQSDYIFTAYRWAYALLSLTVLIQTIRSKEHRKFIPFNFLMWIDTAAVFGVIHLSAGIYLTPIAVAALPWLYNLDRITAIIRQYLLGFQRQRISESLDVLRKSDRLDRDEWKTLLWQICENIAKSCNADRVSICYLGLDSPLIVGRSESKQFDFQDGHLPPVFARVIQTREELWFRTSSDLESYRPPHSHTPKTRYRSDSAIIVPIVCGGEVYGALSLADFNERNLSLEKSDYREHLKSVVQSYVDFLSARLVRRKEVSTSHFQRMSNEWASRFARESVFALDRNTACSQFLDETCKLFGGQAIFFDHHEEDGRLHLTSSCGVDPSVEAHLKSLPFRARASNKVGPFAIAVNDRRTVKVDQIEHLSGILFPESVAALRMTQASSLLVAPVVIGDRVLGLLCFLGNSDQKGQLAEIEAVLDLPLKYLAYQLSRFEASEQVARQEFVLKKFLDPHLVQQLVDSQGDADRAVGSEIDALIILQDLRGSSNRSLSEADLSAYAAKLNQMYNCAQRIADSYGAHVERVAGDGLITLMPEGTSDWKNAPELLFRYLDEVNAIAKELFGTQSTLVCAHRGRVFRGLLGHKNRLAWDLCGGDLNCAFGMEKISKQVSGIVLSASQAFLDALPANARAKFTSAESAQQSVDGIQGHISLFTTEAIRNLQVAVSDHDDSSPISVERVAA